MMKIKAYQKENVNNAKSEKFLGTLEVSIESYER